MKLDLSIQASFLCMKIIIVIHKRPQTTSIIDISLPTDNNVIEKKTRINKYIDRCFLRKIVIEIWGERERERERERYAVLGCTECGLGTIVLISVGNTVGDGTHRSRVSCKINLTKLANIAKDGKHWRLLQGSTADIPQPNSFILFNNL